MIFCEDCRIKKNWPRHAGFPYAGITFGKCEVCGKAKDCNDVPAVKLIKQKTSEERLVNKIMEDGYRQKAEGLVVVNVSGAEAGKLNHRMTDLLRKIFIWNNGDVDWQATYQVRLAAQQGYQTDEENQRNRRT